ncbi:MAG: ATP-binding cassette domain-containing protein [Oscillospiraceae bacterium]|nr:ATP-binding cassette domain-containing protein [Oscillospiraceae bacterium]
MSLSVDIHKLFGGFSLDIAFESDDGVLGLLGASGSGKSMTLKSIAGIVKPDRGRIILDDITLFDSERNINLPPQQRKVGYLFQNYALFPNMTVRQNILCGLRGEKRGANGKGMRAKDMRAQELDEIIAMMQLNGLEKRRPAQLSGGQQQRVALARILAGNPSLLMLDEPFNALDSYLRSHLQLRMKILLKQFGKSTLMVTHDRTEAYRMCDRIALTDAGKVIALKNPKALFSDPGSRQAALLTGCKNVADARKTGDFEIEAPEWGVRLSTAQPVGENLCAVGVRAHYYNPEITDNFFPVCFTDQTEEPFEHIYQFRYKNQSPESPDIWWRVPKSGAQILLPAGLGVDPANVMPLYR